MAIKKKGGEGSGHRVQNVRVKTAKGRKLSSTLWLQRQLNDPYVQRAKAEGYRSRAAYKLIELDEKYKFLKPDSWVVDLGAAPGGWTQVAVKRGAKVVGIDILEMDPIPGAQLLHLDFSDDEAPQRLKDLIGPEAAHGVDTVLSDLAPNTTGHTATDHLRIMALTELAFVFACEVLKDGGTFAAKVWQGGTEHELLHEMKRRFRSVKHFKPKSSRAGSAEMYVVATGYRGA